MLAMLEEDNQETHGGNIILQPPKGSNKLTDVDSDSTGEETNTLKSKKTVNKHIWGWEALLFKSWLHKLVSLQIQDIRYISINILPLTTC